MSMNPQILILIFAEVLGLYGLIVALIMHTNAGDVAAKVTVRVASSSLPNCILIRRSF